MNEDEMVVIRWSWQDVQSLRPDWSQEKCDEVLGTIAKGLHDRSIELGWEVMETLIEMEGQ
jgi:hypothetical protein